MSTHNSSYDKRFSPTFRLKDIYTTELFLYSMVIKSKDERNKYQTQYFHKRMKDPIKREKWNEYYRNYYHTKVKTDPYLLAKRSALRKKYLKKAWEKVFEVYGRICTCCGESNPSFLTIHHIQNDGPTDRKSMGIKCIGTPPNYLRKIALQNNKNKYKILCWNCHFGIHHNNGVCPHKSQISERH